MSLYYLIDENLRGTLAIALVRVATRQGLELDVLQVGDDSAPVLGTQDPEILAWAEAEDRILISQDRKTLARHLGSHLAAGHQCPGIFLLRDVPLILSAEHLVLLAFASDPSEWRNLINYVP